MDVWFSVTLILCYPGAPPGLSDQTASDHQCCLCRRGEMGVWANDWIMQNVFLLHCTGASVEIGGERGLPGCVWGCAEQHCHTAARAPLDVCLCLCSPGSGRAWPPTRPLDPACVCPWDNLPHITRVLVESTHALNWVFHRPISCSYSPP